MKVYPETLPRKIRWHDSFPVAGVGGEASLNLQDGIHPTARRILAENVWSILKAVL